MQEMQEMQVQSLVWEGPMEKKMATKSEIWLTEQNSFLILKIFSIIESDKQPKAKGNWESLWKSYERISRHMPVMKLHLSLVENTDFP